MSSATKKGGRKDNLKQCEKCECLILSDNSDQKCTRPKSNKEKNVYDTSGEGDEGSGEEIVISPKCHETIKIYVKGGPCQDESSHDRDFWPPPNSDTGDGSTRTEPPVQVTRSDTIPSPSKTTQTVDEDDVPKNKNICFRLCRKKKSDPRKKKSDTKKYDTKSSEKCHKDCNTQTCPSGVKIGNITDDLGDIGDLLKTCPNCKNFGKPGGCNTNTIIFPRDQSAGGDGIANLENMLRLEAKTNSRNVEDILNELHRQRREIHELKDMLDTVMRAVREQLFMTAFGKGKAELIEDLHRRNNLERKSNTLSMKSGEEKIEKVKLTHSQSVPPPPPEKKKKRFFLWCK